MTELSRTNTGNPARMLTVAVALGMCGLWASSAANAQTAAVYGTLSNFDVANDSGQDACGYEIELEGVTESDVGGTFDVQRYGRPTISATPAGVRVRWESGIDASTHSCVTKTVAHRSSANFGGTCYQWSPATYDQAGCEHFGVWLMNNGAPRTTSRWLGLDATGTSLVPIGGIVAVPNPYYYVVEGVRAGDPANVEVEIDAPEPAESPELYGDAQWMRIFVVEVPREVALAELMTDNTIVPQDLTQLESDWQIVQDEPAAGGNGTRGQHRNRGSLKPTTRTVVRRIEMHAFTGQYDPITHEALCADGLCNAPAPDEIGAQISAQMTAVLVQSDSVTVTKTGDGTIESADRLISCGGKCVSPYPAATQVTLTARPSSKSRFIGWTGACTGAQVSCTVTAVGHVDVGAAFSTPTATGGGGGGSGGGGGAANPTLSVKVANGKGLIVSAPGNINCGKTCATSVPAGTVVSLTATPEAGFNFVNWSGACTGTAPTCVVTVNATATAQANFSK